MAEIAHSQSDGLNWFTAFRQVKALKQNSSEQDNREKEH
jgi:hypothetical protein